VILDVDEDVIKEDVLSENQGNKWSSVHTDPLK